MRRRAESSVKRRESRHDEVRTPVLSVSFRVSAGRTPTHELFVGFGTEVHDASRCAPAAKGVAGGEWRVAGYMRQDCFLPTADCLPPTSVPPDSIFLDFLVTNGYPQII